MRPRNTIGPLAAAIGISVLVAACGGGGGGGGGGGSTTHLLHVLVVNRDQSVPDHTLRYSGGAPTADSADSQTVDSCSAAVVTYTVEVPFQLFIDDVVVVDSDLLLTPLPEDGDTDLVTQINIDPQGAATTVPGTRGDEVESGRNIAKPAALGICN